MGFRFFDPGPAVSGGPQKVPLGYPWAFPGPPERPPGPKTNQSKKHRNLKEMIEQWSPPKQTVKPLYESSRTYPYPRGLAGPDIVDFWGLNCKSHWKRWGASPPHLFQLVLR